jgi:DHA1 family bicyclomycin/chloramphenicol resistance-like MFS transporter
VAAGALLGFAITGVGGVLGILAALWVILFLIEFIAGNASALALGRHGERASTAAAVIGATEAGVAGLVSPLAGCSISRSRLPESAPRCSLKPSTGRRAPWAS